MPYQPADYAPTWVEWSIFAGGLALFALLITIFTKVFPIIAVWEVAEDQEAIVAPLHVGSREVPEFQVPMGG
jgi:Ni/Fe-hydrogenase subunit HybB-like protein